MNKRNKNGGGFLRDFDCRQPVIEFTGNRNAVIYGCKGVAEYGEDVIRVNTGSLIISFFGKNLELKSLNTTTLEIGGFINDVQFTY
ncbi:MAG: YabP/YqfC family sporulation protein [Candidatus Limousia pullorum]